MQFGFASVVTPTEKETGQADTTLSVWCPGVKGGSAPPPPLPGTYAYRAVPQDPPLSLRIRSAAKPKAVKRPITGLLGLGSLSGWR